jgi:hypothetical protein
MTWTSTAKLVLLCLALVTLAGAETMWSLTLSSVPDPQCRRPASDADTSAVAQPRCCAESEDTTPCCDSTDIAACPCCSSALLVVFSRGE